MGASPITLTAAADIAPDEGKFGHRQEISIFGALEAKVEF